MPILSLSCPEATVVVCGSPAGSAAIVSVSVSVSVCVCVCVCVCVSPGRQLTQDLHWEQVMYLGCWLGLMHQKPQEHLHM